MKGIKKLILENRYYYTTILIMVLTGGIILLLYSKAEVTLWINQHHLPLLDNIILITDKMGTIYFAMLAWVLIWILKGNKTAFYAAVCFMAVALVTTFIKYILFPGVLRPVPYFDTIPDLSLRLIEGVKQLETESFPSGHTSSAFAIFTYFALILPDKRMHFLLALAALSVGYGRMYLSQHFITDVYTGMILGVTITTVLYWFLTRKEVTFPMKTPIQEKP
ncbi:MAG: phosphatase PAP2 family protein [Candidatus Azobacteroides sp.]|nr:phosphatase PAP2 family protein [Candidatus Azobacteroides sp.]